MSWSDMFFPDNPRRREEVVRLSQELLCLMENNFQVTNRLSELLNQEIKTTSLGKISVDKHKSIRENCEVLIGTIRSIQDEVAKMDVKLRERLEPALYQKLHNLTIPISDRINIAGRVLRSAFGILTSSTAVIELINKAATLGRIVISLGRMSTCVVATVTAGVLGLGIDMIASAILGVIERGNLERVIQEYKEGLEDFKPASQQYQDNITDVLATVKFMQGN
ncbi:single-pass membrane and coiled-coil domain-containing protein 3-like [Polyodon spathula]|uniref:single-pass membrane and coiled-coil domain-containing protein 3-like n=1 Tax=Polyodon spathula TaxID=7913 RepID=UPI001B7E931E|nr:single-pass membrane and coiled-coil domain-containing protein 3-like [Polyodon spathula]